MLPRSDRDDVDGLRVVRMNVDRNPKSVGRLPLTSCQESPASSVRITSQCFCMNSTSRRDGASRTMHAVADLRRRIGTVTLTALRRHIAFHEVASLVVGAKRSRGRDGDVHSLADCNCIRERKKDDG